MYPDLLLATLTYPDATPDRAIRNGVALASGLGGAYAGVIEPTILLGVTTYELTPPGWPDDLLLTVAVISDVHVNEPYTPLSRVKDVRRRRMPSSRRRSRSRTSGCSVPGRVRCARG